MTRENTLSGHEVVFFCFVLKCLNYNTSSHENLKFTFVALFCVSRATQGLTLTLCTLHFCLPRLSECNVARALAASCFTRSAWCYTPNKIRVSQKKNLFEKKTPLFLSKNSREMTKKTHNDNHTRDTINYGSFTTMVTFEAVNPIS